MIKRWFFSLPDITQIIIVAGAQQVLSASLILGICIASKGKVAELHHPTWYPTAIFLMYVSTIAVIVFSYRRLSD